jgi:alanine racemase
MVRPGAATFGFLNPGWLQQRFPLVPALSWRCVVVQIKNEPAGASLSYNRTFTTKRPSRIAALPLGYADGYQREFSNKAHVLIRGKRAPVVGIVSMDYTLVDVTDLEDVSVGSEVTLLGKDGGEEIRVEELAAVANTIPYCITSRLGRRPGRCYVRTAPAEPA